MVEKSIPDEVVEEAPEGMVAPSLIIARAGGPHGESEMVQARMQVGEVPDEAGLMEIQRAVVKLYLDSFGEEPARTGVAVLPWFAEQDGDDDV